MAFDSECIIKHIGEEQMKLEDFAVEIYADGADVKGMLEMKEKSYIKGFTTNPTLMKKAGVTDYTEFAKTVLNEIKDVPVSFEVFSDEFDIMEKEARKICSLGDNVFVKIPVMNTRGENAYELIRKLSQDGLKLNVTALMTISQVEAVVDALSDKTDSIVSVFAGRISDAGYNAVDIMRKATEICHTKKGIKSLWASCREAYNIIDAENAGVDIITVQNDILKKTQNFGKDLLEFSLETVKMFADDSKILGFSIL